MSADNRLIDHSDPFEVVELMELTSAELERRAERLLKLSRDLLAQSAHHALMATLPEERTLGRGGVLVTEVEAIAAAKKLDTFTRAQFAEELGLSPSGVSRWLTKLLAHDPPIIERDDSDSTVLYAYLAPPVTRAPAKQVAPERQLITDAPARGAAVHVLKPKQRQRVINMPKQGHHVKQRDARRQAQQERRDAKRNNGR